MNRLTVTRGMALAVLCGVFGCKSGALVAVDSELKGPTVVDFGTVLVGSTAQQTLTLQSQGTQTLEIATVGITPEDAGFGTTFAVPADIAAGASVAFPLTFKPGVAGAFLGTMSIGTNSTEAADVSVELKGTGVALGVTPAELDFGCVAVGTASTAQAVTLSNPGAAPLTITVTPSASADFALTPAANTPITIQPGKTATLEVVFAPLVLSVESETLSLGFDGATIPVKLTGTGASGTLTATPASVAIPGADPNTPVSEAVDVTASSLPAGNACAMAFTLPSGPVLQNGSDGFSVAPGAGWPAALADTGTTSFTVGFEAGASASVADNAIVPYTVLGQPQNLIVPLMATTNNGCGTAPVCNPVTLEVRAWIDGESELVIQGPNVYWQNVQFDVPGLNSGAGQFSGTTLTVCGSPTVWCPTWNGGTCDTCTATTDCGPSGAGTSDTFTCLYPPMSMTQDQTLTLQAITCPDSCSIVQQPSSANGYVAVVDFNDAPTDGAHWYDLTVTYSQ